MIGDNRTRLRENDDLPLCQAPAIKKEPSFFNVHMLVTRKVMCS